MEVFFGGLVFVGIFLGAFGVVFSKRIFLSLLSFWLCSMSVGELFFLHGWNMITYMLWFVFTVLTLLFSILAVTCFPQKWPKRSRGFYGIFGIGILLLAAIAWKCVRAFEENKEHFFSLQKKFLLQENTYVQVWFFWVLGAMVLVFFLKTRFSSLLISQRKKNARKGFEK